jgi:hypothetical protein
MSRSRKAQVYRPITQKDGVPALMRAREHRAERTALRAAIHNALHSPDVEDVEIGDVYIPDGYLIADGCQGHNRPSPDPRDSRK